MLSDTVSSLASRSTTCAATASGCMLRPNMKPFSIAALGGTVVVVRLWGGPAALQLQTLTDLDARIAPWVAGALLAVATVVVVAVCGRMLRRGARAAGLGWADRAGGAVLGIAEGALVVGLLLVVAIAFVGRDHSFLAGSHSVAVLDELSRFAGDAALPAVAAPPRR